jgi:Flp pilus assembly pilin Flp
MFPKGWTHIVGGSRFRESLRRDESGQSMVEYALIIALVAVIAIAALTTLSGTEGVGGLVNTFAQVTGAL